MDRSEKAVFMNMCMIYDDKGNVLVQDRVDTHWGGITFPGGHVEKEESFGASVIREVFEETGLTISELQLCGVKQWHEDKGCRYVVFFYKTNKFTGELVSSKEGEVYWIKLLDIYNMKLARGMENMLKIFLENELNEHYLHIDKNGRWNEQLL